jgi:leukotriene-A4 hydrolase
VASWTGNQKLVFLNAIQDFEQPLTPAQSEAMGKTYGLVESQNVEVKVAYYQVSLKAKDKPTYDGVAELLGRVGRMKFGKPCITVSPMFEKVAKRILPQCGPYSRPSIR